MHADILAVGVSDDEFQKAAKEAIEIAGEAETAIDVGVSRPTLRRWSTGQHIPRQQVKDAYYEEFKRLIAERRKPGVKD